MLCSCNNIISIQIISKHGMCPADYYIILLYTHKKRCFSLYLYVVMHIVIYWLHTAFAAAPSQLAEDGLPDYQETAFEEGII